MKTYYVLPATHGNPQIYGPHVMMKNEADTIRFDFSAWAEDNAALTTVTWSVEAGDAAVSGSALSSSVASSLVTVSNPGRSLIKLTATDGTRTKIVFLDILCKDPNQRAQDDYGFAVAA